jgi:hypothetical protein
MTLRAFATHLVWAAIATAAFSAGYFIAGNSDSRGNTGRDSAARELSSGLTADATHPSETLAVVEDGSRQRPASTPEQVRARVFAVLNETNRVSRLAHLCDLLQDVNAENWREVVDAFRRQSAFEGRELGDEWNMMMQKVGAVAREEAVLDALQSVGPSRDHRARNSLEGWIMADPAAALAWVKSQPPDALEVLDGAVIYSLARISPTEALDYALRVNNQITRDWGIGEIVNGAVQEGGFRRGEELIAATLSRADVAVNIKQRLFQDLVRKRLLMDRLQNRPEDSLQWLDPYLSGDTSPASPSVMKQVVTSAAAVDPEKTLQWLDARAERLTPAQTVPGYTAALQVLYQRSPQEFSRWLDANPTHPARDPAVERYVTDLVASGKTAEAARWVTIVQDPQIKQRIEAAVAQANARAR